MAASESIPSFRISGSVRFDPDEVATWLNEKQAPGSECPRSRANGCGSTAGFEYRDPQRRRSTFPLLQIASKLSWFLGFWNTPTRLASSLELDRFLFHNLWGSLGRNRFCPGRHFLLELIVQVDIGNLTSESINGGDGMIDIARGILSGGVLCGTLGVACYHGVGPHDEQQH
jgi:hypothetical protein